MRKALVERRRFPKFVDPINTFLVNSLFYTSDFYLPDLQKKEMQGAIHAEAGSLPLKRGDGYAVLFYYVPLE